MSIRDVAERVLFAETLEEKLLLGAADAQDVGRGVALVTPDAPGRPAELRVCEKGVRVDFPGTNRLDDERQRGVLMHFLANHELLAAELMALVLLKFPEAPAEYRAGVYAAMREEQMHTQMYLRRMRECGIAFGELPLNDFFWRLIAPVETPMDFVARLNLTFEQANLDFSKHYAGLFREAGDPGTAAVLEKIYLDEIGHVGHGVKWFRHWKGEGRSDWEAFGDVLSFPLAPVRAKGIAPFNAEGRRLAGFDEDFISHLEVCGGSRGRTPVVHWFNPNAESHAGAAAVGRPFSPNKFARALEEDLEILALAWCRRDDVVLMRRPPTREHLATLAAAGLHLPELIEVGKLDGRKLGGLRPWAWSPDACELLQPLAGQVSGNVTWRWRGGDPADWWSKGVGLRLEEALGVKDSRSGMCSDRESALAALGAGPVLYKAAYACAGRGHLRAEEDGAELRAWLERTIAEHGFVVAEPWLDRVVDFSALYEMAPGGVELVGMTQVENDSAGRFRGIKVAPKWSKLLEPEVAEFLFREAEVMDWYAKRIPEMLGDVLPGYVGPVGVDAMVYRREDGSLALRQVVELNVRMTMGRVALELQAKLAPGGWGEFRVLKKGADTGGAIVLNDPGTAKEFVAVWEAS